VAKQHKFQRDALAACSAAVNRIKKSMPLETFKSDVEAIAQSALIGEGYDARVIGAHIKNEPIGDEVFNGFRFTCRERAHKMVWQCDYAFPQGRERITCADVKFSRAGDFTK